MEGTQGAQSCLCLLQAKVELAVFAPWMKDQGTGGFPQTWLLPLEPPAWCLKGNHLEGGVGRGLSKAPLWEGIFHE